MALKTKNNADQNAPESKYQATKDGLFMLAGESKRQLATAIRVLGRMGDADGRSPSYLMEGRTLAGKMRKFEVPVSLLSQKNRFEEKLTTEGVLLEEGTSRYVADYVRSCCPQKFFTRVKGEGWVTLDGGTPGYVIGGEFFSDEDREIYIYQQAHENSIFSQSGEWKNWQTLAEFCHGNPQMVTALCASFSAGLLQLLDMSTWMLMLIGPTSTGKTSIANLCASLLASPKQYIRPWTATENGLEAETLQKKDVPFILDELGQADANVISKAAYRLTNESTKIRAKSDGSLDNVQSIRTVVFSTGEESPVSIMRRAGMSVVAGKYARLVCIPVGGPHGAFNDLHGARNGAEFADQIVRQARKSYGLAWPPFVEHLVKNQKAIIKKYGEIEQKIRDYLTDGLEISESEGAIQRVLNRFVLTAFAGMVAIDAEVVPWEKNEVVESVRHCFELWLRQYREDMPAPENGLIETIRYELLSNRSKILPLADYTDPTKSTKIGYYHLPRGKEEAEFLILPGFLKRLAGAKYSEREMEGALRRSGFLVTDSRNGPKKQVRIPERVDLRPRFYALKESILHE